jgi:peptide/nickel transport system substrate-binding protein
MIRLLNQHFRTGWIVVLALLLVAACAPATTPATDEESAPSTAPASGGRLAIGLATEPVTLDPAAGFYMAERFILMNIFDTLITMAPDGSLHPGLATAWTVNAEATEFTFTLREDVTFHDGAAFNAEAVAVAFERTQAITDFSVAQTMMADYAGADVADERTVTVRFNAPKPRFLEDVSQPWMGIPSPAASDLAQNPVGTGPFVFRGWAIQDHVSLTRNPDYTWAADFSTHDGPALVDEILFRFLPDQASRLSALQSGEVQVVEDPAAQEATPFIADGTFNVMTFTAPGMPSHMMINVELAPTDELAVRQAMIHAVNQEELTAVAFAGLQSPAHNVLSPTTFGYSEEAANLYGFDLARAEALLEEAGWVDADGDGLRERGGQPLRLIYPAIPAYEGAFMELLAAYLSEAGFAVEIRTMDDAGVFEFANAGQHNLVNMGWTSSDPGVLDIVYNSANIEGGSAFTRFRDEELDNALNAAATELDRDARAGRYAEAQRIIMENALALPVHNYDRVMLMTPAVQGWRFDAEGYPYLHEVALAQ